MVASEPLTQDSSRWVEVPEYSAVIATESPDGLSVALVEMDV